MNFRPTYKKGVGSVIVAIIVWLFVYVPTIPNPTSPPFHRDPIFNPASLVILIIVVLFYTIWSLVEKKKRGKK